MVVEQSFSYSQAGAGNMSASRIYSKLLEESDADRKAEAAKVRIVVAFPTVAFPRARRSLPRSPSDDVRLTLPPPSPPRRSSGTATATAI